MPRDTLLKKTLFACDELSGFVHACGLVRPTGLEGLEPKSVRKKLKQPSFAAGVHRDEVYKGAEELGVELDEHIRNVVAALQPIAGELGLPDRLAPAVSSLRHVSSWPWLGSDPGHGRNGQPRPRTMPSETNDSSRRRARRPVAAEELQHLVRPRETTASAGCARSGGSCSTANRPGRCRGRRVPG